MRKESEKSCKYCEICCIGINEKNVQRIKIFIKNTHKIKNKYIYKTKKNWLFESEFAMLKKEDE